MSTVAEKLAGLGTSYTYETLPPAVVAKAKTIIIDSLGCALGASDSEPAAIARQVALSLGGRPEATLIGSGERTSAHQATFVNGTMIRYLDCNDAYIARDPSHPSGNVATALAFAESGGRSGRDVIAALAYGYEIHARLIEHIGEPNLWNRGWHHATTAPFPAAATVAHLMELPVERTAHAFAIAGTQCAALTEMRRGVVPMIKATAEAKGAYDGAFAALLAGAGLTGPLSIFEGDYGYIKVLGGGGDIGKLTAPGLDYSILKSTIKRYPVEIMSQSPVHAALELRREHGIDPRDITKVVVGLFDYYFKKPAFDKSKLIPTTRETADHSPTYCVTVALLDGDVGPAQFTEERLKAADVQDLIRRVELVVAPELNALYPATTPGVTTIHLKDGRVLSKRIDHPPGHPANPLSREELERKFRALAGPYITKDRAGEIIRKVWELERLDDIGELMQLTVRESGRA
jgi:2-methylcitrate dehydratase